MYTATRTIDSSMAKATSHISSSVLYSFLCKMNEVNVTIETSWIRAGTRLL